MGAHPTAAHQTLREGRRWPSETIIESLVDSVNAVFVS